MSKTNPSNFQEDPEERERNVFVEQVSTLEELKGKAPKLFGIKSGVEGLDDLFFITKLEKGKVKTIPLGGYPAYGVFNITGVPDTGKSLMAEQFAVTQASLGYPVCFVTVEQPASFLYSGLKMRAEALGIKFSKIENSIVVIDAASNSTLRESIPALLDTLAYAIEKYDTKSVVIDSITGLYEAKEMMARQVVRSLYNFMKKWHQTALFISQKRSGHEELTAEAAGGYAVGHIVDGSLVLVKKEISSRYEMSLYKAELGSLVRLFRIDGCRMAGHDTRVRLLEITKVGLVKIGPPLSELAKTK